MADVSVTNSFSAGTTIVSAEMNTNFSDLTTYINNMNDGTTSWEALKTSGNLTVSGTAAVTGNTTLTGTLSVGGTAAITGTLGVTGATTLTGGVAGATTFSGAITATGGIVNLFGYRRPNLQYVSATTVKVENNTGTEHQTTIVFPDGTVRSVTENVAAAHKYRLFDITATAEFTTGTEDSGLYTGFSEATNTWYFIYAVKSAIDAAKFVLVGTTTAPIRSQVATLNSQLGTNGWVYLGVIRNGDNKSATGDILSFVQSGPKTVFTNIVTPTAPNDRPINGLELVEETNTDSSYTYSDGASGNDIPSQLKLVDWVTSSFFASNAQAAIYNQAKSVQYGLYYSGNFGSIIVPDRDVTAGIMNSSGNAVKYIGLSGFRDSVLSSGINPII